MVSSLKDTKMYLTDSKIPSYLRHNFQVLVNVDEVGVEHRHLKAKTWEKNHKTKLMFK